MKSQEIIQLLRHATLCDSDAEARFQFLLLDRASQGISKLSNNIWTYFSLVPSDPVPVVRSNEGLQFSQSTLVYSTARILFTRRRLLVR